MNTTVAGMDFFEELELEINQVLFCFVLPIRTPSRYTTVSLIILSIQEQRTEVLSASILLVFSCIFCCSLWLMIYDNKGD